MVAVAVSTGPIEEIAKVRLLIGIAIPIPGGFAFVGNTILIAVVACPEGQIAGISPVVAVAIGFTLIRNAVGIAVVACPVACIATIRDLIIVTIRLAFIRHSIVVAVVAGSERQVKLVEHAVVIAVSSRSGSVQHTSGGGQTQQ